MDFDLAQLWRRSGSGRAGEKVLRPIVIPATMATNLYRAIYAPVLARWERHAAKVLQAYRQTIDELTRDAPADFTRLLDEATADIDGLIVTLRPALDDWASDVERMHRGKWQGAVLTATGVDLKTLIGPEDARDTLQALIGRNVDLVSNVSAQTRSRIAQAVFAGYQSRQPPAKVAKAIREATGMGRDRAMRIAADQNVKLAAALNDERRRQAGVNVWEWVHSGKRYPRPEHKARNGKRYDDAAKSGPRKPPQDRPGQLPYCGCTSRAVVELAHDAPESSAPPQASPPSAPAPTRTPRAPRAARVRTPAAPRQARAARPAPPVRSLDLAAREHVLTNGRAEGVEHLVAYDKARGVMLASAKGERSSVALTDEMLTILASPQGNLVLHHNHPGSSSFSPADITIGTTYPGSKAIWAHGHDGSSFFATRAKPGKDGPSRQIMTNAEFDVMRTLTAAVNAGKITPEDYSAFFWHSVIMLLDARGHIEYRFQLPAQKQARWREVKRRVWGDAMKEDKDLADDY